MNDRELQDLLRRAGAPEREASYWERFPARVMALARARARQEGRSPAAARSASGPRALRRLFATSHGGFRLRPVFALGVALACIGLGFWLGLRRANRSTGTEPQLAAVRKCYRELETLFPRQIRAIVFDTNDMRLELADKADVPPSPPLYVRIYTPKGSEAFVTFSGQHLRVNGESCEVLLDHTGTVLLVGEHSVWSSATPPQGQSAGWRIEARPLDKTS